MFFSLCRDFGRAVLLLNYSIQEKSGDCKCLLVIMTYVVCKKVPCCKGDDLQSAYILCYFIRNRRWALIVCSGFTRGEYHIIRVDFIVALRRTKGRGRRTLRSPSPPWNHACVVHWTPPPHPGESAAAGHDCCRGLGAIWVAVFRCCRLSPVPNIVQLSVFGSVSFAFQSGCPAYVVRFSLLGGRSFVPAATWGFAFSFVGFARNLLRRLTREWIVCFCG